ncbi:hypothetical protein [Staphylococcus pasteuri]|uniref:hypothetical protein n=1 Tax=Staphylococcus pasteuri TaxID=45972 RepID=UPI002DB85391|nr:hypothetical protein [Staphylococcus pasteuri]MEB7434519.1 hypothetical protein [Staphylococcus pasteuri]
MLKSKAIKELFNVQEIKDKFKIIKDYNLQIKGFSNISIDVLENNEKYISNQISNTQNVKKISNVIRNNIKHEQNLDYLLSTEKILEKYNKDFMGLLTIFENDKYGEVTEKIIQNLAINTPSVSSKTISTNKDKESKLRNIIQSLELKIQTKDKKINELLKLNSDLKKEIAEYEKHTLKLSDNIKVKNTELITKDEILQNKIDELNLLKDTIKTEEDYSLQVINEENINNDAKINIIGAPDLWKLENSQNVNFYKERDIDKFIYNFNNNTNSKFYAVKFGITSYSSRILKKQVDIIFINSKEEFIKLLKEPKNEK